ncbi:MAG: amino acid ABC transporter permease/ATP-binding protein [Rouxiella aceris]|uniref:amino acid ABC transporter permease/ATP-binding protein n=1 Tax=Rouxiella aceris TaxID=2703884 RepID=UPI0028513DBF|nr:amino acid ABC transporter permease/ATP-binding protein [Rouxiella aceris]MDR3434619.1 amino acid ABC transporter permease/ATP-binding protein [Rouxiella aceris]
MTFDWNYFFSLFSLRAFWLASVTVVELSVLAWGIGLVLGFIVASGRQSGPGWVKGASGIYIWLFRSIPLLVLVVFVYNLPQMIPATGRFLGNAFFAGLVATVLVETAYMAEIHRGGLLSVAKGQHEAGHALGLGFLGIQRRIVIPQALQISLPALINEFVTIVKQTSLVSVISLPELLMTGQRLYAENFMVMETLAAVALYYVLIVSLFTLLFQLLERRVNVQARSPQTRSEPELQQLRQQATPLVFRQPELLPGSPDALTLKNIHKAYGTHQVLQGIDLRVAPGEVISIIGPSGSGKTSLIRTINGLEKLNSGEIVLFGESFIAASDSGKTAAMRRGIRRVGMVFQGFNLFPHYTILQNLMLAPRYHRQSASESECRSQALYLLDKVGLLAHVDKYPHQLSGGQQQRVAIARALALSPDIMLFDEPTSALDPELVGEVLKVIGDLAREGMTMLIVTHEIDFALAISDRILLMEQGHIQVDATPKLIANGHAQPDLQRIRQFMGINLAGVA